MTRDNGLCRPCREAGRTTIAAQIDHILALTNGGSNADANLRAICLPCHKAKTARDKGHTHRPRIGLDGWPIE